MKYNIFQKGSIHIAPSNPTLNYAEDRLHTMDGKVTRLREKLSAVEGYYDYIIIDCPPSTGILTTNALVASKWVLVPVDVGFYSLVGIKQLLARVQEVQKFSSSAVQSPARPVEIMGVLLTMFDERNTLSRQIREKVEGAFGDRVFKSVIRRKVRLAEAPSHLKSIFEYDWDSGSSEDYMNLAREVIRKTRD